MGRYPTSQVASKCLAPFELTNAGILRGVYPECAWACGPPKEMKIAGVVTPA